MGLWVLISWPPDFGPVVSHQILDEMNGETRRLSSWLNAKGSEEEARIPDSPSRTLPPTTQLSSSKLCVLRLLPSPHSAL